ncbi:MAG: hypothetical protein ACRDLN_06185 [Solirubrobacteraceae bacterium]
MELRRESSRDLLTYTDESYAFALLRDGTAGLAYLLKDRLGDLEDLSAP